MHYIRSIDEFERDEKVAAVKQIVANLVEEYSLAFRQNKWMTNATKNATLNKSRNWASIYLIVPILNFSADSE
jgi:predicted metalloendopeptidase